VIPAKTTHEQMPKIVAQESNQKLDLDSEETSNYEKPNHLSKFSATAINTKTEATEPSLSSRKAYRKRDSSQKDVSFKPLD